MKKITGKELVAMGYQPGKWFKETLKEANSLKLEGEALKVFVDERAPKLVYPFDQPQPYFKNIEAESEAEESNVKSVFQTMDEVMKTPTILDGAVMPDACPTGGKGQIPVGGVVVTEGAIHPSMHSADICCSVMMTSFGKIDPKDVLDAAHQLTHFGPGGRSDERFTLPESLKQKLEENYFTGTERSLQLAKSHLGTQGDGNHFLYIGKSENTGDTVMVTHHGSRGLGANLYKHGMKIAEGFRKTLSPSTLKGNAWIPYDEPIGKNYWEALQLVRAWTKLNHEVLHQATCDELDITPELRFWNEHNFVFKDGNRFYHAKGATPLDDKFIPDSHEGLRLIPLNMSEPILVVKGATTDNNLGFAPHGAGRNVSRSKHIKSKADRKVEDVFMQETEGLDIRFFSGHVDLSELPSAYKDAANVQAQMEQFDLGEVVDRIMPYGCIMAGDWKRDAPWRKRKRK